MKKNKSQRIPVLDIPGLGAFQLLNDNDPELLMNGTPGTLMFNADAKFYELSEKFNSNCPVNVLDFLSAQRQLKARLYALKGGREMSKVQPENIPDVLKQYDQWVNWKYELNDRGEETKVPYNPRTLNKAKSNNSTTWGHSIRPLRILTTPTE